MSTSAEMVTITAPASKSLSHRALIAASLAARRCDLENVLQSVDLDVTRQCLEAAGAVMAQQDALLRVDGFKEGPLGGGQGADPSGLGKPVDIFVNESGTSCRLLTAVLAAGHGAFKVHGADRMHERPIGELTTALERLGAKFDWLGNEGCPPFVLHAEGLSGGRVEISLEESSQYLSGLLLAAPLARKPMSIVLTGSKSLSWPYVALTLRVMQDFGIEFSVQTRDDSGEWKSVPWRSLKRAEPGRTRFEIQPGVYEGADYRVEGDWSNGSYLLAAGIVGSRPVRVEGLHADSLQGDRAVLEILAQMGARFATDYTGVTAYPSSLRGVDVDMGRCPDLVPTVAVTAAFARGDTVIRGVPHLRLKECDRLAAMQTQLARAGCPVEETADGLLVHGRGPEGLRDGESVELHCFGDHRIAMSLSLLAFAGVRPVLDDVLCVSKSYPGFWEDWAKVSPANLELQRS